MAKSFKDYFGDFNDMRDRLLFSVGNLAQVPQKATNLLPAIERFISSGNPVLAQTGALLKTRTLAVRDSARLQYDNAQKLMSDMMVFKNTVEKHPAFQTMMTQTSSEMLFSLLGKVLTRSTDLEFFQKAVTTAVKFASSAASATAALQKQSDEIKAITVLVQQTNDYASGKGILPVVTTPVGEKAPVSKTVYIAGAGILALGLAYLAGRKK